MFKWLVRIGMFCLLLCMWSPAANADALSGVSLSGAGSSGDFYFTPGLLGSDYLNFAITGCAGGAPGCGLDGGINGAQILTIGSVTAPFAWTLDPSSASGNLLNCCVGSIGETTWDFSGSTTNFSIIDVNSSPFQVNGTIAWGVLTETPGGDSLAGTAAWTSTFGPSGSDPFSVSLAAPSCTDLTTELPVTPCSLTAVAQSDPIYALESLGTGRFGPSTPVPEPSSLLLLATGFLGLCVLRRQLA